MIEFFVPGVPKAQPRQYRFAKKLPDGRVIARAITPNTAENWKNQVATAAQHLIPAQPIPGAIYLTLAFQMPRPKAHFTKKGLRPAAPVPHTSKPDCDNLGKAVMDALSVLQFWGDDAQVCQLYITKRYDEQPGCRVWLKAEG